MKKILLVIYGCHGAGKSTLARNILQLDGKNFTEHSCEFGKYTLSEHENIVAVGKYSINCGGADSLSRTAFYYGMLEHLLNFSRNRFIVIEGILFSSMYKTPLNEFLKYKYEYGVEVLQIFLYADYKTSYIRVLQRSGRQPKVENIKNKVNSVNNTIKKFKELNEFPSTTINTIGKNSEEVFDEAEKFINRFWHIQNT